MKKSTVLFTLSISLGFVLSSTAQVTQLKDQTVVQPLKKDVEVANFTDHNHYGQSWGGNANYGLSVATMGNGDGIRGFTASDGRTPAGATSHAGVFGAAKSSKGPVVGVYGMTESYDQFAAGVLGVGNALTGNGAGVYGKINSNGEGAKGVWGQSDARTGKTYGVYGQNSSEDQESAGVMGFVWHSIGVIGESAGKFGVGVYGKANAGEGQNYGVVGETASKSDGAVGVKGIALNSQGVTYGVYGETRSLASDAAGVFGLAANQNLDARQFGVKGMIYATAKKSAGVVGIGTLGKDREHFSAETFGVYGIHESKSPESAAGRFEVTCGQGWAKAVYATTNSDEGIAGFFKAENSQGKNYALQAISNSPEGYALYAEGKVHLGGDVTWKPKTGYLSVGAGSFISSSERGLYEFFDVDENSRLKSRLSVFDFRIITPYVNDGQRLRVSSMSGKTLVFVAGLSLPHHAEIKKMTCYWTDPYDSKIADSETGDWVSRKGQKPSAALLLTAFMDSDIPRVHQSKLISIDGKGNNPHNVFYSTTGMVDPKHAGYAIVDNSKFQYCIAVDLPETSMFRGALIEYTIAEPY